MIEKPKKEEIIESINQLLASYERLPTHAMNEFAMHYDIQTLLLLMKAMLLSD